MPSEPMSKEQLEQYRKYFLINPWISVMGREAGLNLLAEVDRLRAENEELMTYAKAE